MLKLLPSSLPFFLLYRVVNIRICLFQVSLQTPNWVAALLRFCFERKTICCVQTRRWVFPWPLVYRLFFVWLLAVVRRRIKTFLCCLHTTLCSWLYFINIDTLSYVTTVSRHFPLAVRHMKQAHSTICSHATYLVVCYLQSILRVLLQESTFLVRCVLNRVSARRVVNSDERVWCAVS